VHARERDAARVVEHDAGAGRRGARVVGTDRVPNPAAAAAGLVGAGAGARAGAGHRQRVVRAGVAQLDAATRAVRGDAMEGERRAADVGVGGVERSASGGVDRVEGAGDVEGAAGGGLQALAAGGVDVQTAAGECERV
ncbi:MAG: hypothetical protein AVDCRST_MAG17-1147, partial [uncultured Solirubrobacterales bacterium]